MEENTLHKHSINWFIGENRAPQSQGIKGLCKQLNVFGGIFSFGSSFGYCRAPHKFLSIQYVRTVFVMSVTLWWRTGVNTVLLNP